jgi:hypothetical protein
MRLCATSSLAPEMHELFHRTMRSRCAPCFYLEPLQLESTQVTFAGALFKVSEESSFQSLDKRIYDCKLRNEKKITQVRNEFSVHVRNHPDR